MYRVSNDYAKPVLICSLRRSSIDNNMGDSVPITRTQTFSKREVQVIELLMQGKSTKLIASQLGVSTRSVEHYLTHIYEKLGVCSRTEAVIKLINLFEI